MRLTIQLVQEELCRSLKNNKNKVSSMASLHRDYKQSLPDEGKGMCKKNEI